MQVGRDIYPIHFGDAMLIPPNMPHRAIIHDSKVPYRRFVFWISTEFYEKQVQISPCYSYAIDYAIENKKYIYVPVGETITLVIVLVLYL